MVVAIQVTEVKGEEKGPIWDCALNELLYGFIASKIWAHFLSFFGPFGPIGPFGPQLIYLMPDAIYLL